MSHDCDRICVLSALHTSEGATGGEAAIVEDCGPLLSLRVTNERLRAVSGLSSESLGAETP